VKLEWRREEYGGNWYYSPQFDMEGWLCPALFKYFELARRNYTFAPNPYLFPPPRAGEDEGGA
jgi:hypothetical protein